MLNPANFHLLSDTVARARQHLAAPSDFEVWLLAYGVDSATAKYASAPAPPQQAANFRKRQ
jgi:hypothetical protein